MPAPADLLAFEEAWPRHSGFKEEAIRREFGITPARYYQLLHRVAVSREGLQVNPLVARRISRRLLNRVNQGTAYRESV